jgi:lipopolysaccharide export system ATP-binding protein
VEIRTKELVKIYRGRRVVDQISLEVHDGEVVGLLGQNGAGKTTTFYMIVGLVKPAAGQVLLDGRDITRLPMYQRARAGIAYLPQEPSVFRNLSVVDNIRLVLQMQRLTAREVNARADTLMEELHITHIRTSLGSKLSGGERRRVEIARALAANPRFILLDEPFTGVDPMAIDDIEAIIKRLAKREENPIGILITDHNVEAMLRITERLYIVTNGKKSYEGPSEGVIDDPVAQATYFGDWYSQSRARARSEAEAELKRILASEGDTLHTVCPVCGTINASSARFCNHCGNRLAEGADAAH